MRDWIDQRLHYALGYAMARSRRGLRSPEEVVESVMAWAEEREGWQHPGRCGAGCELDLKWWRKGAERGAG